MKQIAFVGSAGLLKVPVKRKGYQKVLYFYKGKQSKHKQKKKQKQRDLSCGFVAVINTVGSRNFWKGVFKTDLTHKSANTELILKSR